MAIGFQVGLLRNPFSSQCVARNPKPSVTDC